MQNLRLNRRHFSTAPISLRRSFFASLATLLLLVVASDPASATERHFTYTYEVTTAENGELELENWITWQFHRGRDGEANTNNFDFRHEFEYGITDRLQASLYFADWHINDHPDGDNRAHYDDAALEVIYRLSNPVTDFLGSAVYGEVRRGPEFCELESKILLQKNIGKGIAAYNATLEARWTGEHLNQREGEFAQTLAVSYEINPHVSVGVEALHEIDMPNWDKIEKSVLWAGPNASLRSGHWYVTATVFARLTNNEKEPNAQTRLITGFEF
jgi:hypothetical protein